MIPALQGLVSAVIMTVAFESVVLIFFGKFTPSRFFLIFVLINILTNIVVNSVSLAVYGVVSIYVYAIIMAILEIAVVIAEGYVYSLMDENKKRMYLLSLIANLASLALGSLLMWAIL